MKPTATFKASLREACRALTLSALECTFRRRHHFTLVFLDDLLLGIPAVLSVSKALQLIKGGSSGWMKENLPDMGEFAWQDGYAAFTVSKSQVSEIEEYIRNQREHHRVKTFEEEYRAFLDRHEIDYEEEYVFG